MENFIFGVEYEIMISEVGSVDKNQTCRSSVVLQVSVFSA